MRILFIVILLFPVILMGGNSVGGSKDGTSGDNTGQHRPVYDSGPGQLYLPEVQVGDVIVKGVSLQHVGEYKGYQFFVLEK